jgi:magnesium and cobalt exporter, CNNM family
MELLILLSLILLNGVFAMSEMSVVSSRKVRLEQWADEGRPGARVALALANEPGDFLSTIQIWITAIAISTGALGEATVAKDLAGQFSAFSLLRPYADTLALAVVLVGVTLCSLIIGELVPKRLALRNPEGIASATARPMQLLSQLASPLTKALSIATEAVLRLFGIQALQGPPITQEEIKVLMEQGARAGVFEKHEQVMVSRVFRMDERRLASAMTPRVDIAYLDLNEPFDANRQKLLDSPHSRFPLCKDGLDHIVGIVHAKALLDDAFAGRIANLASHASKPLYLPDTLTVMELLEMFKKRRQHLALVVDEYGELQGLVTMTDVMETLVGDIPTVEEAYEPDIVRREDGSLLMDGAVAAERFREVTGLEQQLPGEDTGSYHTLGGFVMMQLGRVPQVGDKFESSGFRFEIVDMDGNRVDKLLVSPTAAGSRRNLPPRPPV